MAWEGWFEFGGVEIINTDRTEAYAKHANAGWFRPTVSNGSLAQITGEPEYASPLQDDAPWVDPDKPASFGFFGCYPLDINGIEDSTMTAPVTESTGDGGVVGRVRRATRSVTFSLALMGADECAVEYGFNWLKAAMYGGPCQGRSDQDCNVGNNLCFLACPPGVDMFSPYVPPEGDPPKDVLRTNLSPNPSIEKSIVGWGTVGNSTDAPIRVVNKAATGSSRLQAKGNGTSTLPKVTQSIGPLGQDDVVSVSARVRADPAVLNKNSSLDNGLAYWMNYPGSGTKFTSTPHGYINAGGVITWPANQAVQRAGILSSVSGLTVGKVYTMTAVMKNNNAAAAKSAPYLRIDPLGTVGTPLTTVGIWSTRTITFTAATSTIAIEVMNSKVSTSSGGTTTVDEIKLFAAENTPTKAVLNIATDAGTTIQEFQFNWAPDSTGYQTVQGTILVPAGASGIQVRPGLVTPNNYTGYLGVDQVMVEKAPTVGTYFDGNTGDTSTLKYDWVGPNGLSTSTQSTPKPHTYRTTQVQRVNYCINPSAEANVSGWTAAGAGTTVTAVTAGKTSGAKAFQISHADVGAAGMNLTTPVAASPGETWTVSADLALAAGQGANSMNLRMRAQPGNIFLDTLTITLTATPTRYSVTSVLPAGTTGVDIQTTRATAGSHIYTMDSILLERTDTAQPYFDGDSPDNSDVQYDWLGTAKASISTLSTITLTPAIPPDPPQFDPTDCFTDLLRSLHGCTTTVGPTVTGKRTTVSGGCVWTVSITVTAANPSAFSDARPLIQGFGDPKVLVPYVGGLIPPGGGFDVNGFIESEAKCPVPTFQPIYDPQCPIVIPPPPVPSIALSCFSFPTNYKRRQFIIPPQNVPLWGNVVPYFEIHTPRHEVRSLRLRFYGDPDGDGRTLQDRCSFCGDIVFSYIPAGATMIFDGADQQVYVLFPGGARQRADALVFGSDGSPFEWPQLTCGYGYIVTLDLPQTATVPVVDMSLYARAV